MRLEQYVMGVGQRFETRAERGACVLDRHVGPQRRIRDRLHHGQRIFESVTKLIGVGARRLRFGARALDVTSIAPLDFTDFQRNRFRVDPRLP